MSLITTWHPTFALFRNPYEWGAFQCDLQRFRRLIEGKLEAPPKIAAPSAINVYRLGAKPFVCIDIETEPENWDEPWTGKMPTRAKLKLLGLGCWEWGVSLHERKHPEAWRAAKRLLADPDIIKVFHNGLWFDVPILQRYGFKVEGPIEDTRDARRVLSSTSKLSLAYCTSIYADADPWKQDDEDDSKGLVFTTNLDKLREYNAKDCVYDARCWKGMTDEPEWNTPRVQRLYEVQKSIARIASKMHFNGIPINRERWVWMKWALLKEYGERERQFLGAVGINGFNCQPEHLRALIYQRHATGKYAALGRFNLPDPFDPAMYTNEEMDKCSVDENALTQLLIDPGTPSELKALIKLYWAAEEVWKRRSTFVASKMVKRAIGKDWRLRPGWNSAGTDTGRWSCSEPNVMNIEKMLRWMYKAEPGRCLVGADWSQLELWMMYAVSKDETLGNNLKSGDVYTADAIDWFGLPKETTKETCPAKMRKGSKVIHLGSQYAAGPPTIHRQALKQDRNFEWAMTRQLHAKFLSTYRRTTEYWKEEHERVCETGYSETRLLQRRRVYPREPPPTETANYPIQGTAADITNLATITIDERLTKEVPSAKLIIQLHDALYVDCRTKDAKKVEEILKESMEVECSIDGGVYMFRTEVTVGDSWDEL